MRALKKVPAFFRSLGVGALATAVDMAALLLLVEVLHVPAVQANVPALLTGALVQFFGNRHAVFDAARGRMRDQVLGFAAVETGTLLLNALVFHILMTATPIPYALARAAGSLLVFVGFSYPLWARVFKTARA